MDLHKHGQTTINVRIHSWYIESVLLENMMPTKYKAFYMAIGKGMYSSQKKSASERDTWGYTLCKMRSRWWIDKSCIFWKSFNTSSLGSVKDTIKSNYFSNKLAIHKHGSSLLESFPADGWSLVCRDTMV